MSLHFWRTVGRRVSQERIREPLLARQREPTEGGHPPYSEPFRTYPDFTVLTRQDRNNLARFFPILAQPQRITT